MILRIGIGLVWEFANALNQATMIVMGRRRGRRENAGAEKKGFN